MSKSIGRVIDQGVRQYQRQTFTQETQWESEPYREKKEEPDKTGYPGSDFVKPVFTEKKKNIQIFTPPLEERKLRIIFSWFWAALWQVLWELLLWQFF